MSLDVATPPEVEPIDRDSAKRQARAPDDSSEDEYFDELIPAARELIESFLGRTLVTTEYVLRLPCFPACGIELPKPPLQSVESVSYVDADGDTVEMDPSEYEVHAAGVKPRILPAFGTSWPATRSGHPEAVVVEFTCGYGDAATDVPHRARQACRQLVAHWHLQREPVVTGTIVAEMPLTVKSLLWPLKIVEV